MKRGPESNLESKVLKKAKKQPPQRTPMDIEVDDQSVNDDALHINESMAVSVLLQFKAEKSFEYGEPEYLVDEELDFYNAFEYRLQTLELQNQFLTQQLQMLLAKEDLVAASEQSEKPQIEAKVNGFSRGSILRAVSSNVKYYAVYKGLRSAINHGFHFVPFPGDFILKPFVSFIVSKATQPLKKEADKTAGILVEDAKGVLSQILSRDTNKDSPELEPNDGSEEKLNVSPDVEVNQNDDSDEFEVIEQCPAPVLFSTSQDEEKMCPIDAEPEPSEEKTTPFFKSFFTFR